VRVPQDLEDSELAPGAEPAVQPGPTGAR
jgi:hypothetical protein